MDLENLSIESISAYKQANIAIEAQVAVAKKASNQSKVAGELMVAAIESAAPPTRTLEAGKGVRLNTVA